MHPPACLGAGLVQALQERLLGFVGAKEIRPVIAPVQDVIDA